MAGIGGIQGSEIAKERDIIIPDDNFASVVKTKKLSAWELFICKYSQTYPVLAHSVASLVINVSAAITSCDVMLTAEQHLWVTSQTDRVGHTWGHCIGYLTTNRPSNAQITSWMKGTF